MRGAKVLRVRRARAFRDATVSVAYHREMDDHLQDGVLKDAVPLAEVRVAYVGAANCRRPTEIGD